MAQSIFGGDSDDEEFEEPEESPKLKRKSKHREETPKRKRNRQISAPEPQEDTEEPAQANEPSEFDQIIATLKKGRRRRKDRDGDTSWDGVVQQFLMKMDAAAEEDELANRESRPALNKVKMLSDVSTQLRK